MLSSGLSFNIVNSKIPLAIPYSISFTTSRIFARITLSSVSSVGISISPLSNCCLSRVSNFSVLSRPTQTPIKRAPDTFVSLFARSTSASTTTTDSSGIPAFKMPSFVTPYLPEGSTCINSPLDSSRSKVAPLLTASTGVGSTKRPFPSSINRLTNSVRPAARGPLTSKTGVILSRSLFVPEPCFCVSALIAKPALPGNTKLSSLLSSFRASLICPATRGSRYVKKPMTAAAYCSGVMVSNGFVDPAVGLASPRLLL
mmetsp:Transcript_15460/g.27956  ORF Transcript_15460/g.27956 Transcript_15460/m.27956 type:complete len:257 (-) Transcript_15460:708-1478(-)